MIFLCFVGPGGWKIRVVHCVSCGSGDDHSLASLSRTSAIQVNVKSFSLWKGGCVYFAFDCM